jgi:hypothetical protein
LSEYSFLTGAGDSESDELDPSTSMPSHSSPSESAASLASEGCLEPYTTCWTGVEISLDRSDIMRSTVIMEDGEACALVVCWELFRGVVLRATALAVAAAPVNGAARAFLVVPVAGVSPSLFLFEERIPDIVDGVTA